MGSEILRFPGNVPQSPDSLIKYLEEWIKYYKITF